MIDHQEKCIRSLVPNAVKKQKYHLNQMANDLFTAKIAIEREENQEDAINLSVLFKQFNFLGL